VHSLYLPGLIHLDILIDKHHMVVPSLEGFIINRMTEDFWRYDKHTTVLDTDVQIDIGLVKDTVALYCRLGLSKKN
jgi:hypothetical protein